MELFLRIYSYRISLDATSARLPNSVFTFSNPLSNNFRVEKKMPLVNVKAKNLLKDIGSEDKVGELG